MGATPRRDFLKSRSPPFGLLDPPRFAWYQAIRHQRHYSPVARVARASEERCPKASHLRNFLCESCVASCGMTGAVPVRELLSCTSHSQLFLGAAALARYGCFRSVADLVNDVPRPDALRRTHAKSSAYEIMLKLSFSLCRRLTTWRRDVQVALAHGTLMRALHAGPSSTIRTSSRHLEPPSILIPPLCSCLSAGSS